MSEALGLAEAIDELRRAIASAAERADESAIRFDIRSVTIELQAVLTRQGEGKVGFKVPIIDLEVGGGVSISHERTHTITLELEAPRDSATGHLIAVGEGLGKPLH